MKLLVCQNRDDERPTIESSAFWKTRVVIDIFSPLFFHRTILWSETLIRPNRWIFFFFTIFRLPTSVVFRKFRRQTFVSVFFFQTPSDGFEEKNTCVRSTTNRVISPVALNSTANARQSCKTRVVFTWSSDGHRNDVVRRHTKSWLTIKIGIYVDLCRNRPGARISIMHTCILSPTCAVIIGFFFIVRSEFTFRRRRPSLSALIVSTHHSYSSRRSIRLRDKKALTFEHHNISCFEFCSFFLCYNFQIPNGSDWYPSTHISYRTRINYECFFFLFFYNVSDLGGHTIQYISHNINP